VSARRIHRERGEVAQVSPVEVESRRRSLIRLRLDPAAEADSHVAVEQHRLDHVGRQRRIPELADHPGATAALAELDQRHPARSGSPAPAAELDPAAALEEQLTDQEPAALGDEDYAPPTCRPGAQSC
jgi:hypothetical protein